MTNRARLNHPASSPTPRLFHSLVAIASLTALAGCELVLGPSGPQVANVVGIEVDRLEGTVGELLPGVPQVRVEDDAGQGVDGVEVYFRVVDGGGSLSAPSAVSNAQGQVRLPSWTLGPEVGEQRLEAGVEGVVAVLITAHADPGAATDLEPLAQPAVTGPVTSSMGVVSVNVLDRFGNRVPDTEVRFSVAEGNGAIQSSQVISDGDGVASAGEWFLGSRAGPNRLEARLANEQGVDFLVEGRPLPPSEARGVALANGGEEGDDEGGDGDAGTEDLPWEVPSVLVGHKVPIAPTVRVRDPHGNGVGGISVRFEVMEGDGYVSQPEQITDKQGRASPVYWQLGIRSGMNRLEARVDGVGSVIFEAVALPGGVNGADYASLHHQHSQAGAAVPIRPAVRVWDVHGNPVPGVAVTFQTTTAGATLEGGDATTNAEGVARVGAWMLSAVPGENRLRAQLEGFDPFTFIAVGETGGPAVIHAHQGNGQTGPPNVALPTALAARVVDAVGNPVPGVQMNFVVTSGGGSILGPRPITNSQGVALAGAWTLGSDLGPQTVEARATGVAAAVFTATAEAGPPSGITAYAGAGQSGPAGQPLPVAPTVRITDSQGNPVSGVPVSFAVTRGGGTVASSTPTSGANGVAQAGAWTLGSRGGLNQVTASASGVGTVVFSASAQPATWPVKITANVNTGGQVVKRYITASGSGLSGPLDITQPLEVPAGTSLTGSPGDVPPGWEFSHWEIYMYNASSPAYNGLASPGPRSGSNVLLAQSSAPVPAQLTVNGPLEIILVYKAAQGGGGETDGGGNGGDSSTTVPTQMVFFGGQGQTAAAGTMVPHNPTIRVLNAQGNPVEGITVRFDVTSGGGTVSHGGVSVTNEFGGAGLGWTLGTQGGGNSLRVSLPDHPAISTLTFNATATGGTGGGEGGGSGDGGDGGGGSGDGGDGGDGDGGGGDDPPPPPTQMVFFGGQNQTAAAGTMVPHNPTIRVLNAQGNPVEGITVRFDVTSGGGTVTHGGVSVTNEFGGAGLGWTLGTQGGANSLKVSLPDYPAISTLTFNATATGGTGGDGGGGDSGGDDGGGDSGGDDGGGDSGGDDDPPPPPPPTSSDPPPPGPNDPSDGWTGNTIPLRIIEGGSMAGLPAVPVTITANGVSKTFYRSSVGAGRTVNVPRGVQLTVTAHFTPNPAAGLGNYGFTALKMKGMNALWGFTPDQVNHSNNPSWEPYTNGVAHDQPPKPTWTWGGSLTGICGSMPPGHADHFWRYSPPEWVTTANGVDFLVVWLLEHQVPRHTC